MQKMNKTSTPPHRALSRDIIFAPESELIEKAINEAEFRSEKLKIYKIQNGIIGLHYDKAGVFYPDGKYVDESVYCYRGVPQYSLNKIDDVSNVEFIDRDVVYCGYSKAFHFGHFLLEGLNRVYPILNEKYKNCLFVFIEPYSTPKKWATDLLKLAGVAPENILVLKTATKFRNVYVPQQSFDLTTYGTTENLHLMQKISSNAPDLFHYEKVYLSRAKMGKLRTWGEERIQEIFARNGYHIIYPETMTVPEQVAVLKHCKYLAGCAGTALHLSVFMPCGGTVIMLKRNSNVDTGSLTPQKILGLELGHNLIYISASIEPSKSNHFSKFSKPQIIGMTPYLRAFFDEYGFEVLPDDLLPDSAAMRGYKRALVKYKCVKFVSGLSHVLSCFLPTKSMRATVREAIIKYLMPMQ